MELNWSTFVLEIINFLILVWLLARFLYRPVMNIIDKRRQEISRQLSTADAVRKEAETLRLNYQDSMAQWDREKIATRNKLQESIAAERRQLLVELHRDLVQEREKAGILNQRQLEDEKNRLERLAVQQGANFCSRLLDRLAGPGLEAAIVDLIIEDLDKLSPDQREQLRQKPGRNTNGVTIYSVFPITDDKKLLLEQKLALVTDTSLHYTYQQDQKLIAGLRIKIGAWLLQANLQDELKLFADPTHTFDINER